MLTKSDYLTEVADNIYQVQLPLPFALNIVNVYLLHGDNGWTIVDTGINTPQARERWQRVFTELNVQPQDIEQIVLTHFHPDHFGLCGWLEGMVAEAGKGIPVCLSSIDINQARLIWWQETDKNFEDFLLACNMPSADAHSVARGMFKTGQMTLPHPTGLTPLIPGETIKIGNRTFNMIHAPGHSDGQLLFYDENDHLLLSGDHVLMKITPNIGVWPDTAPNPLGRFLNSLEGLKSMDVRLALPGHKWLIEDWPGRIQELIDHHHQRLGHTLDAIAQGADTVYEASLKVFDSQYFSPHEWRFAMAETLAHMELLAVQGRLKRMNTAPYAYEIVRE